MTRLLVFGFCPLPFENTAKNFGPGIRAWQFIQPLVSSGQADVTLIANRIPYIYPDSTPPEVYSDDRGFAYYSFSESEYQNNRRIQELHDRVKPDAILATTIFSALPLSGLRTDCPVWIDLFGHVMAEAQAKAYRYQDDSFLNHFRNHELLAIQKGDKFSTVSRAQEFAAVGELGLINRLNSRTAGYTFCHSIPCAMEPAVYTHDKTVMRGINVPEQAFVVLWSGGFNTWTDVDTLVAGLELAMDQNPEIWFVSTGGQIDGHDEITYPSFVRKVEQSRHSDRFLLRGWVPKNEVHNYYFEANIGINIDRFMYEGVFGSKNRVIDWMRADLPSLIGELCELSIDLPARGLAYSYPLGDPPALAEILLKLADDRQSVTETGQRAGKFGRDTLTFDITTRPFQHWLQNPKKAPDHAAGYEAHPSPAIASDDSYVKKLEAELSLKNHHLADLEKYIRHIETEWRKSCCNEPQIASLQMERPALAGIPLKLSEEPKVSVILVTWNGLSDIDPCIRSIIDHDYPNMECIVIDNGSTDGTPEFILQNFPLIRLIRNKKNRGFTGGVNQGILAAGGDVIFLLNQDAVMKPGLMREILHILSDEFIAVAGCKIFNPDGRTLQHAGGILHENGLTDHYGAGQEDIGQFDEDRDMDYVTGAAFAFKRKLVDEIGLFDPRYFPAYFEELDFCTRATRAGYRIRYCHRAEAIHHESTSTGKFSQRFYYLYHRNRLKWILKHFTLRYFLGRFRRAEWKWLRHHSPKEQWFPLLRAYCRVSHRIIWLWIRSIKEKADL